MAKPRNLYGVERDDEDNLYARSSPKKNKTAKPKPAYDSSLFGPKVNGQGPNIGANAGKTPTRQYSKPAAPSVSGGFAAGLTGTKPASFLGQIGELLKGAQAPKRTSSPLNDYLMGLRLTPPASEDIAEGGEGGDAGMQFGAYGKSMNDFSGEATSLVDQLLGAYDGSITEGRRQAARGRHSETAEAMRAAYAHAADTLRGDQDRAQKRQGETNEMLGQNTQTAVQSNDQTTQGSVQGINAELANAGLANDPDLAGLTARLQGDNQFNNAQANERGNTAQTAAAGRSTADMGRMQSDVAATTQMGLGTQNRNNLRLNDTLGQLDDEEAQAKAAYQQQRQAAMLQMMQTLYDQDSARYQTGVDAQRMQMGYDQDVDNQAWSREMDMANLGMQRESHDMEMRAAMQPQAPQPISAQAAQAAMKWLTESGATPVTGGFQINGKVVPRDRAYQQALQELGLASGAPTQYGSGTGAPGFLGNVGSMLQQALANGGARR